MAMPKADDLPVAMGKPADVPVVPDGPTPPETQAPDRLDKKGKGKGDDGATGGRRPYEDVLGELKALQPRVEELRMALAPLAAIPDDPRKAEGEVLYRLVREGRGQAITCADIRRARSALGLP